MKKTASMILALLILLSTGMVPALAATEDTELAVVPMENTRTVLRLKDGTSRDYAGMLKAGALGDSALAGLADSYEIFYNGEPVISVGLNNIKGSGGALGASSMMNGFCAVDFTYGDNNECFLTGLSPDRVDEIETKMIGACSKGSSFTVADIGFIDTEKEDVENYDSQLCWAAATSNALTYTGWAQYAGFDNEDDLFDMFAENFTDEGALVAYGATWFLNGVGDTIDGITTAAPKKPDGGAYAPDYAYENVVTEHMFYPDGICEQSKILKEELKSGCGIVLSGQFMFGEGGHATTCWGYAVDNNYSEDEQMHYKMFFISDSDNDKGTAEDRRNIPDRIMALELAHGLENALWHSVNYDSYQLLGYASIKPYSGSLIKETSPSAVKDKRAAADLSVGDISLIADSGVTRSDRVCADTGFTLIIPAENHSEASFEGRVSWEFKLYDKSGNLIDREVKTADYDEFYQENYNLDYGLSKGEYRFEAEINYNRTVREAYYTNNKRTFDFKVVEPFADTDSASVTPRVSEGRAAPVEPVNELAFVCLFLVGGIPGDQAARIKKVWAEISYNFDGIWYDSDARTACAFSSENPNSSSGFDVFVPLSPYAKKAKVTLVTETDDGVYSYLPEKKISYSVPEDQLSVPFDESDLELTIRSLEPVTGENGKTDVEFEGLITGIPRALLITNNYNNSLSFVDIMLKCYDPSQDEWVGWFNDDSTAYIVTDEGLSVTGMIDGSYSRALISICLEFDDFYYLQSDELDIWGAVPGKVYVSAGAGSASDFSPVSDTDTGFAEGEKLVLAIRNTGVVTASGTYELMARDTDGGLTGLTSKQSFSVEPGKTFESPAIYSFNAPLKAGTYALVARIEGAQAECADLGTLTVRSGRPEIIGDINSDGFIDVLDATLIQKYSVGKAMLTPEQIKVADVNGDSIADVLDAALVQKYAAEKITEFPKKA